MEVHGYSFREGFLMSLDLTIAIPVQNEELNLPGCLDAIGNGFAERIIV